MKSHTLLLGTAVITLGLGVGVAFAQTTSTNFVTVSAGSASTTPTAGQNGQIIGTVTISAPQSGDFGNIYLASLPISISAANGAQASNLTSCQLYNANGTAVTTGNNTIGAAQGSNTFTFDQPLSLAGGQSQTYSVRCNVASGTPSGGSFTLSASSAQFSPGLMVNLNVSPSARVGAQDTLMALLTLSGQRSGSAVQVPSIPLNTTFGNGALPAYLSDCRVRNLSNIGAPLNNGGNAIGIVAGNNSIPLDTPLQIAAGTTATLAITCDISSGAPVGGTIAFATTPSTLQASVVGTGTTVTPTTGYSTASQLGATSGTVTLTNVSTPTPTPIPGIPNTGIGDTTANLILMTLSGILALFGVIVTRRMLMS